ncbi:MAG TPA: hypothetical protein VF938_00415 [Candidatus Angelobacter sp.]
MDLSAKHQRLELSLRALGRTLVAYSGGVDSAYLAWQAHRVLGGDMLAVIADSPSLARTQLQDALAFAHEHGIAIEIIQTERWTARSTSAMTASAVSTVKTSFSR